MTSQSSQSKSSLTEGDVDVIVRLLSDYSARLRKSVDQRYQSRRRRSLTLLGVLGSTTIVGAITLEFLMYPNKPLGNTTSPEPYFFYFSFPSLCFC